MTRNVRVLLGIGVAILSTLLAASLRLSLDPQLGHEAPFLIFTFSVFISAVISGMWAGLLATLFGLVLGTYLFLAANTVRPHAGEVQAATFAILAIGSSVLARSLLSSREKRLAAEKARAESDAALDVVEVQLTQVLDRLKGYSIITLSPDGVVTTWNKGSELMKGYSEEEAIGLHLEEFFTPADRQAGLPEKVLREAREKGEAQYTGEHLRKGGEVLIGDVLLISLRDPDGQLAGYLRMTRDVTREVRLMRELEELYSKEKRQREEAQRVGRMKDEFLSTISHELRTPLNAILGWAQLLTKGGLSADIVKDAIETIYRNAKVQVTLVDDLLDMGRIISGKLKISTKRINLLPVVEAAIDTVRPAALAKEIEIVAEWEYDEIMVEGDSSRLQQAYWNILSNAVKFTPQGGTIWVSVVAKSDSVTISIRDSGPGIDAQLLPRIFDRFFQADSSSTRTHGGLGLGLAIAKSLTELHGGEIRAASRKGEGATFTLSLPMFAPARLDDSVELERVRTQQDEHPILPASGKEPAKKLVDPV